MLRLAAGAVRKVGSHALTNTLLETTHMRLRSFELRVSCFEFQSETRNLKPETSRAPRLGIFLSSLQRSFFVSRLLRPRWRTGVLALSVAAFLPVSVAAQIENIPALLTRPKVLCGNFEQTKQLAGLKKPLVSSGRFCVVADKGVLWRTLQPFPNTLRLTREEITQTSGERVTMRLSAAQESTVAVIHSVLFSLLAGDFGQLEKHFELDGKVIEQHWSVILKPRDAGLARILGQIALAGGAYVTSIVIDESSGDRMRVQFSAIQSGESAMTGREAEAFSK